MLINRFGCAHQDSPTHLLHGAKVMRTSEMDCCRSSEEYQMIVVMRIRSKPIVILEY